MASLTSQQKHLSECTKANTPKWNFDGLSVTAKVLSVYDGDTLTVAFDTFGLGFFQHNIRLSGIDAPEMKGKSPEEKSAAMNARDFLRATCLDKEVNVTVESTDKYGRLLASVTIDEYDLSTMMLESKHAVPYSGGTREPYVLQS